MFLTFFTITFSDKIITICDRFMVAICDLRSKNRFLGWLEARPTDFHSYSFSLVFNSFLAGQTRLCGHFLHLLKSGPPLFPLYQSQVIPHSLVFIALWICSANLNLSDCKI